MNWLFLIPVFPFLGFLILAFLSRDLRNRLVNITPVLVAISAVMAIIGFIHYLPGGAEGESFVKLSWSLGQVGGHPLHMTLGLDSLSIIMLTMVTIVAFCVHIYSLYYMKDDERKGWYFCVLQLFTAAMLVLVSTGSLLLVFAMWEVMGVCSYLLIGFWYTQEAPCRASVKAFMVTRAGDVGFFIALAAIYTACGSFEFEEIIHSAPHWAPATVVVVGIGLLWAAAGKSAQLPLSVWLPDAMAGPTPSSSIIHAATMVAAGIFMVARMMPVLMKSPLVLHVALWVGIITALFGAFLAIFQTDIKRMLAFSTISQLGLMFAALGVGVTEGALFHLVTHAFFKCMLFLASGSIIHAVHTQDSREMGGLFKKLPIVATIYTIGALALAGVIPFSGFFSKDAILDSFLIHGQPVVFGLGLVMATMTALYVSKMWLTIFIGKPRSEKAEHAHEGTMLEIVPMSILAFFVVVLGFTAKIWLGYLDIEVESPTLLMGSISTGIVLLGASIGTTMYLKGIDFDWLQKRFPRLIRATEARLYTDKFYDVCFINPCFVVGRWLWSLDSHVIDGVVNGVVAIYRHLTPLFWGVDDHIIDGTVNGVVATYKRTAPLVWGIDDHLIDGAVNATASGYKRFTPLIQGMDDHVIDGAVNATGAVYKGLTGLVQGMDDHVIDGSINAAAAGYKRLAALTWSADSKGLDGVANSLGVGLESASKLTRKAETGRVGTYQRYIVGAVIALLVVLFAVLILKGAV